MIEVFSWPTPNGHKIHIMLEECGLAYRAIPVNIGAGAQFKPEFLKIRPNNKIPAMTDPQGPDGHPISLFESGAILLYLAAKTGKFLPQADRAKFEVLQWLMFQMGTVGPMLGQTHHFRLYAPEKIEYAINRYAMEAKRQLDVLNRQLAGHEYIAGADYTIADIAIWPWYGGIALGRSYPGADEFLATHEYEHLMRWAKQIAERPAVKRGRIVNKLTGPENEQLHERHGAGDFELRTEDKIQRTPEAEDLAGAADDAI